MPRVTVGLPVYNEDKFLKEASDSLLSQTFEDFELIISDNGSTDKTEEICREYIRKDQRIKYHRLDKNYGAATNFNRLFGCSRCEYFKCVTADDYSVPEQVAKSVEVLDKEPTVVLSYPKTKDAFFPILRLRGSESNSPSLYSEGFYCRKMVL